MFICCVYIFVPFCTYISIFEKREKNVEARMIRPLHTWIWLFVLCSVAQSGFVHSYALCMRARSCVCICRAVFILDRVKWIDPVNPSMTLPIFILKSTVWRINKSDRKKTHILRRNRTQKKNCKYWRERKKNAEERRKDYRTRLNFVNSNIKFKAFRKIHKSRAQPNEIAKTHNNRSPLKQQQQQQHEQ